ncbi:MAG: dTMP kinase, partial [Planctomycetes bacterium]|nr:dTMP kinase [Planctomycetota bacterium]
MAEEIIGLIGGSGLGDVLFERFGGFEAVAVETPFGEPSGDVMVGELGGRKVAFINRHGEGHKLSPSDVPYAANIFAMKKLGVRTLISTCAVGSLREEYAPKDLIVVDQFIDKTFRRRSSFFEGVAAVHCEMAEPGGTPLGQSIRELLLHTEADQVPSVTAELLLYAADRAQHVDTVIRPALLRGDWVLSDRFAGSTLAYQGYGRGLDRQLITRLESIATTGLEPDLTAWLMVPVEVSLQRRHGEKEDRIEAE